MRLDCAMCVVRFYGPNSDRHTPKPKEATTQINGTTLCDNHAVEYYQPSTQPREHKASE